MPDRPRRNVNITPGNWKADVVKYVGGALGILVLLFSACVLLIDLVVPHISYETELQLFKALDAVGFTIPGERQPAMEARIRSLLEQVPPECRRLEYPVQVEVVKSDLVNALALPGGRIVVLTGLLDKLETENELMFVLGHEMGHMVNRDHLSGFLRGALLNTLMALLERATGIDLSSDPLDLTELAFSRGKESAADRLGVDFVHCAYGHVAGARQFFEAMGSGNQGARWKAYLSTHPGWEDRIGKLDRYEREMGYVEGESRPLPAVFR